MGPADLLAVAAAREHEAELPVVQVQALPGEGLVPLPAEDAEPARSGGARMWQCAGGPSGFMLSGFGAWPQFPQGAMALLEARQKGVRAGRVLGS